jgi:hypothetical protein
MAQQKGVQTSDDVIDHIIHRRKPTLVLSLHSTGDCLESHVEGVKSRQRRHTKYKTSEMVITMSTTEAVDSQVMTQYLCFGKSTKCGSIAAEIAVAIAVAVIRRRETPNK